MKSKLNKTAIKVGMNVKVIRIRKNLTQETVAVNAGISQNTMSDIERGRTSPSVDTVALIADALGVELHKLFIFED